MKAPILITALAVLTSTAFVTPAWADGYEFFTVDRGKAAKLVYVGQIREKESGRVVREPAYFMVTEKRSGMTFPFVNDRPGHYRSPDIGESVEQLAGTAVNPADLEFEVSVAGYKNVKLTNAPRRNKGVVEMNFRVEREGGPAAAAAAAGEGAPPASDLIDHSMQAPGVEQTDDSSGRSRRFLFLGIAGVAIIAGAAARTSGRRRSTAR
jgi:hypothetical protein